MTRPIPRASRRAMLCGFAALPAFTLPAVTAASDLALACDALVDRTRWLDSISNTTGWTDDDWEREFSANSLVYDRAAEEPSQNERDRAAKARLALEDYLRFHPEKLGWEEGERLMVVVLREVIALAMPESRVLSAAGCNWPEGA